MRFKKMHIGLMVIALSLVLGSALSTLPEVKANPGGDLLYYYNFEHGYNTGVASDNSYGTPLTHINSQIWNNLDYYDSTLNNLVEVSGTGFTPVLSDDSPERNGKRSFELYDKDGLPWSRAVTDANGIFIRNQDHSNDVSDRVQLSLIPMGKDGFHHGSEFDIGFSMLIPPVAEDKFGDRYADSFAPIEIPGADSQWIQLFTMHTYPGSTAFTINVGSASGSVTFDEVQMKIGAYQLTDWYDPSRETLDDSQFSQKMIRGIWYDFLIQGSVGANLSVKMKKSTESWSEGGNPYGHEVYSYTGPYGWHLASTENVRYYPKITLYRGKYVTSGNDRARRHAIWIDEVRVGTSQAAVIPGLLG